MKVIINSLNRFNCKRIFSKDFDSSKLNRNAKWRLLTAQIQKKLALRTLKVTNVINQCPICDSNQFLIFCTIYKYPYHQCKKCGHIYSSLVPNLNNLYKSKSHVQLQERVYINKKVFENRVKYITQPKVDYINKIVDKKGLWLDIGCGTGETLFSAQKDGWEVKGFDVDPQQIKFAKSKKLPVVETYLTAKTIKEYADDFNKAKVISFFNLLEHISDPVNFIKMISKYVKKGTYFVIEVPRHPSLSSFLCQIFFDQTYRHIYPPDHLHIFTEKSMSLLFNKSYLIPEAIWNYGQDAYELANFLIANSKNKKTDNLLWLLESSNNLQRGIDSKELSDIMIVVARKK